MACSISVDDEQQVIFDALWQVYRKYDQEESQAAANKKGVLSIIQDLQNVYSCTQPNNHKPSRFETNKRKTTSARDQPQRLSNGRIYYPTFEYKLVEENEHGMRYEMRTPAYNERNAWATVNVKQTEDGQTMLCVMLFGRPWDTEKEFCFSSEMLTLPADRCLEAHKEWFGEGTFHLELKTSKHCLNIQ